MNSLLCCIFEMIRTEYRWSSTDNVVYTGVDNLLVWHETIYATVFVCETDDGGEILLDLALSAAYFMGEPHLEDSVTEPGLYVVYFSEDNLTSEQTSDAEEIEALYGIKIVDYQYDAPIENSFSFFGK